ncbi:alpha/beta hydrolase [Adhaeribacter radiodurans]|uniref:Alpha/beta hydrolase n=1 Tax=Adhaeribacter radiodurans TaxID=2745197 RepID=A0A7L7LCT8_9BACT|nr:alpha/beta hydrolase [Adhaeribacter radiodurans]QMU30656.1 alpha/beta hydrolase [Adhaeribacter radiodurans]
MVITGAVVLSFIFILLGVIYNFQDRLIFFPEKLPHDYRFSFANPFQELFFKASDGAEIHALHFRVKEPKGVILYFHGNAGSLRTWGYLAEEYTPYHYDVFMVDYRGFGKSTGIRTEAALHKDAQLAYQHLVQEYEESKIIVFGRSLGTGIAVLVAAQNQPKCLILETPFFNFADVAKTHYSFLPVTLLLKYAFRSDEWIQKVNCPIYIFHGTSDNVVPYPSGEKLAQLADPAKTKFITIQNGNHNDLSNFRQYQQVLQAILE